MSTSRQKSAYYVQAEPFSVPSSTPNGAYGVREADLWYGNVSGHLLDDLQSDNDQHDTYPIRSSADPSFHVCQSAMQPLGKPREKNRISNSDLAATTISLACLAMAIISVGNETVSWRLGVANNQLIVVGFLLSIMNLCLGSVTSTFCLLIEARFGCSTLQNYDGILRNKPMAPRLSLRWRVVLTFFLILPIALSVAYKTFKGGQSAKRVGSMEYVSIPTNYGMMAAPGLMYAWTRPTGVPQFFNATQPFRASTSLVNGSEPRLPRFPQPYGYNILLLNGNSTAILDTLQPDFITSVQDVLAVGESWVVNAPVIGTVATLNTSKAFDPSAFELAFLSACNSEGDVSWTYDFMNIWDNHNQSSFWLFNEQDNRSDQSMQYLVLAPGYSSSNNCTLLLPHVRLYNVHRQQCQGTWSITRAGTELINGSCDDAPAPADKQRVIVENSLYLTDFYMPALLDFLAAFGPFGSRNQSEWTGPYAATSVAAMIWSRIVSLCTSKAPLSTAGGYNASAFPAVWNTSDGIPMTYEDVAMLYPVSPSDQTIFYIRPTLRKSPLLYFYLAIQPLLILAILGFTFTMHSVPLDKGFGLVSILSGIDRHTLDILSGASLSGELAHRVKLVIVPTDDGQTGKIALQALPEDRGSNHKERLRRNVVYY